MEFLIGIGQRIQLQNYYRKNLLCFIYVAIRSDTFGSADFNKWPVIWANGSFNGFLQRNLKTSITLPSKENVQTAVDNSNYDVYPWDDSVDSFRNELEGNKSGGNKFM